MTTHGNHEDSPADLAHYVERFRNMPANSDQPTFTTKQGTVLSGELLRFTMLCGVISAVAEFMFRVLQLPRSVEIHDAAGVEAQSCTWIQ
jgi:hypothetical protein